VFHVLISDGGAAAAAPPQRVHTVNVIAFCRFLFWAEWVPVQFRLFYFDSSAIFAPCSPPPTSLRSDAADY
jgi:hypothetical protein